jgi:hypothetical protein
MFNFLKTKTVAEVQKETPTQLTLEFTKDIRPLWKSLASKKEITREDMAALCIYRSTIKNEGVEGAKSRLLKSFSPVTNTIKLANGTTPYGAMYAGLIYLHCSNIVKWITQEEIKSITEIAKEILKERHTK